MTEALLYLEINLASVALVVIVWLKTRGLSRMVAQRNFVMALGMEIVFFLSDTIYVMITDGLLPLGAAARLACKEFYFLFTGLLCFFWFLYFEYVQKSPFVERKSLVALSTTLLWILAALLLINIPTGILFSIDETGAYVRGPLFPLQYVLSYVYIVCSSARALILFLRRDRVIDRRIYLTLALFPLAPCLSGLLQYFFPQLPIACVAISLSTLIMYLNWTDEMISVDALTHLNNRKQLTYSYEQWQKSQADGIPFYLLLIDANKFKGINDTYGHIQGDQALKMIAESLRIACLGLPKRANIARYGGDEFVVLLEAEEEATVLMLKERIGWILDEMGKRTEVPFELTVSIGIAKAEKKMGLKELIAEADHRMYQEKGNRTDK